MGESQFKPLYRYTTFASAIDILLTDELTLLSPNTWSDKNDTKFLDAYVKKEGIAAVLALCFTHASETAHHWSSFGASSDGVRLCFDWDALQHDVDALDGAILKEVQYLKIGEVKEYVGESKDWPFLKRHPYRGEEEVRLLFRSEDDPVTFKRMSLTPGTLREFALSPLLHKSLTDGVKKLVRHAIGAKDIKLIRSTLNENKTWIKTIEDAV